MSTLADTGKDTFDFSGVRGGKTPLAVVDDYGMVWMNPNFVDSTGLNTSGTPLYTQAQLQAALARQDSLIAEAKNRELGIIDADNVVSDDIHTASMQAESEPMEEFTFKPALG